MRSKRFIIILAIGITCLLAGAVIVIFQAPVGWKIFGFRDRPGDRRVAWVEPPGRFPQKGGRISSVPPATVPGGFVDFAGRTLVLRGLLSQTSPAWGASSTGIAFDRLRDSGINTVMVPLRWQDIETAPMQVSVDTLLAIRQFLDAAAARGIGVILVNTAPFSGRAACGWAPDAPVWAFRMPPDHSDAGGVKCTDSSSGDLRAAAVFRSDFLDARWTPDNITLQDHLIRAWVKLAEVASRSAGLVGYAIADGMACPADIDSTACSAAWTEYIDRFANSVRAVDGSALFFLDTESPDGPPPAGQVSIIEVVPGAADDSLRGPLTTITDGIWTLDRKLAAGSAAFLESVDAIERRGRSWLVEYPATASDTSPIATGILPNMLEMARPRPEAVAGRNMKFNFDRLTLPEGPDDPASGPGATDVFTLEFDDITDTGRDVVETTVWLPTGTLYRHPTDGDAPGWTLDISDGSANWLAGQRDVILWRTAKGFGPHRMRITPWGGRRLVSSNENRGSN